MTKRGMQSGTTAHKVWKYLKQQDKPVTNKKIATDLNLSRKMVNYAMNVISRHHMFDTIPNLLDMRSVSYYVPARYLEHLEEEA